MKNLILILFAGILMLAGCREKVEDPTIYATIDYDSIYIKSYDYIEYVNIPYVDPYYVYHPESNSVSYFIDIDKDSINDYELRVGHYLYVGSPHYSFNATYVSISSLDSLNYKIAVQKDQLYAPAKGFLTGESIDNDSFYQAESDISAHVPYIYEDFIGGNVNIGVRVHTSSGNRYGYINMIVKGASVVLVKSVMNINKDNCVVGVYH